MSPPGGLSFSTLQQPLRGTPMLGGDGDGRWGGIFWGWFSEEGLGTGEVAGNFEIGRKLLGENGRPLFGNANYLQVDMVTMVAPPFHSCLKPPASSACPGSGRGICGTSLQKIRQGMWCRTHLTVYTTCRSWEKITGQTPKLGSFQSSPLASNPKIWRC